MASRKNMVFFAATVGIVMAGTMVGASIKTDREVAAIQTEVATDPRARLRELLMHRESLVASRIIQQKKLDNVLRREQQTDAMETGEQGMVGSNPGT